MFLQAAEQTGFSLGKGLFVYKPLGRRLYNVLYDQKGFFFGRASSRLIWLASCKMGSAAHVTYFPALYGWLVLCVIPYNKDKLANPWARQASHSMFLWDGNS